MAAAAYSRIFRLSIRSRNSRRQGQRDGGGVGQIGPAPVMLLQQEDRLQRGQITPPSFEVADMNKTSQNP